MDLTGRKEVPACVSDKHSREVVADLKTICRAAALDFPTLKNAAQKWTVPIREWKNAMNQFAILDEGRVPIPTL